jgi:hypothetical protein
MRTTQALAVAALTLAALALPAGANPVIDGEANRPAPRPADFRVPNPPGPRLVLRAGRPGADQQTHVRLPAALAKNRRADAARPGRGPTIAAGVALALGLVTGGLWLSRTGRRRVLLSAAALSVAGLLVVGVSGCPWDRQLVDWCVDESIPPPSCSLDGNLTGEALLEIDGQTDAVEVVVNRAELAAWAEQAAKPPPPPPDPPPSAPGVRLISPEQRTSP